MPDLDGFEVCERLKGDPETCDIPIVFVTAYFESDEIKYRAIDVGSEGFLQKPISIPNFIATIRSMLRIRDANLEKRTERDRLSAMVEQKTSELKRAQRAMLSLLEDLTSENASRKSAETELATRNEYLDSVIQTTQDGFFAISRDGRVLETNKAFREMLGYGPELQPGMSLAEIDCDHDRPALDAILSGIEADGHATLICDYTKRDGVRLPVELSASFLPGSSPRFIFFCRDLSERNRREAEMRNLYEQFVHAQKMESIGRLAGGVAHDFNNMLGVILGQSELALSEMASGSRTYNRLMEIRSASLRSSNLTRQLLAFARKQTISPRVLNLNDAIASMIKMIRRLIGEDIDLIWQPSEDIFPVFMDPGQIDQILANLCVNARDAISGSGRISIRTRRYSFDEMPMAWPEDIPHGDYSLFEVRDTGCGMDESVLSRMFEPFFTTKEVGKGTGLGLATVYGIVKQNECQIAVESEVGSGTAFRIFVPRYLGAEKIAAVDPGKQSGRIDGATLLVVEDEPVLLEMTSEMLRSLGCAVVQAATPGMALDAFAECGDRIDGIVTDVILPETSGPDLVRKLRQIRPSLGVLYVSGYSPEELVERYDSESIAWFLQKPFSRADLADRVSAMLSSSRVPEPGVMTDCRD
jgi:PAS domain S-box-containing protein